MKATIMSEITKPTTHVLESMPASVSSGVLDPSRPPALTIDAGDIVSYPNTWTQWGNQAKFGMSFADREPLRRQFPTGPYSNLGPVEVRGSEPGDVLECRMLSLRTIDWGWNSFPLGVGALPSDFKEPYVHYFRFDEEREHADFVEGIRIPLAPSTGATPSGSTANTPIDGASGMRMPSTKSACSRSSSKHPHPAGPVDG